MTKLPNRLERHVTTICEEFSPRSVDDRDNLAATAAYIRKQLGAVDTNLTEQKFQTSGQSFRNLIARFGPPSEERVVVGAHYDTVRGSPGADDNASGVAGLLELAPLLADIELDIGVDLAAYCPEEPPFFGSPSMGSAHHARALRNQNVNVRGMIALEMIGYFSDEPGSQRFPLFLMRPFYPGTGNFVIVAGQFGQQPLVNRVRDAMADSTTLPTESIVAPRLLPGIDFSDHRSFWAQGYDAVMVTDTAFYRNPHYHSPTDRPETLDYERMAQVVRAVQGAVLHLANSDK